MRAAIIPTLARATGLSFEEASDAFAAARESALARNDDRDDTRTFILTVEVFRKAHPFTLDSFEAAREEAADGPDGKPTA